MAVSDVSLDRNTDAQTGCLLADHGLEVVEGIHPIQHRSLCDILVFGEAEASQVVCSAMRPAVMRTVWVALVMT